MFAPRYLKHARLLLRHTQKYLRYKSDVLHAPVLEEIKVAMQQLQDAFRQRDRKQIENRAKELDQKLHKLAPVTAESHWRENCEVILVAIVVAVGIRSYFLQPFKIPTGSMQPTLNGIIGYSSQKPSPNLLRQIGEFVVRGRNYIDVVSREDDVIQQVQPKKILFFFTFSRIICQHQTFLVYAPPETLAHDFNVARDRQIRRGEIIARGAVDTGDQVFVDKFTYNFMKPHRGDVFVFRTQGILGIPDQTQFYIKRLAGLPGDVLRIDPPSLYVNGKLAEGYGFQRVMAAKLGYLGYSEGPFEVRELEKQLEELQVAKEKAKATGLADRVVELESNEQETRERLESGKAKLVVPEHGYFAMGDNSHNSFDSRWWGTVPEENLVGRGLLVYWPFHPHWGLIR